MPSGSNGTQQLGYCFLHVGLNIPTEMSRSFWWGMWWKKLERTKIAPPPDWWEDQVRTQHVWLKSRHSWHWPAKSSTQFHCRLCSSRGQRKGTVYKCTRCDMGLYVVPYFAEYHTRLNF